MTGKLWEPRIEWTDEMVVQLRQMWKANIPAADIAQALGYIGRRNAIIGKAHRIGLKGMRQYRNPGKKPRMAAPVMLPVPQAPRLPTLGFQDRRFAWEPPLDRHPERQHMLSDHGES